MQPFRMEMTILLAADSREDAAKVWDELVASLPEGAVCEGGALSAMDRDDVIPGSPLAAALH